MTKHVPMPQKPKAPHSAGVMTVPASDYVYLMQRKEDAAVLSERLVSLCRAYKGEVQGFVLKAYITPEEGVAWVARFCERASVDKGVVL